MEFGLWFFFLARFLIGHWEMVLVMTFAWQSNIVVPSLLFYFWQQEKWIILIISSEQQNVVLSYSGLKANPLEFLDFFRYCSFCSHVCSAKCLFPSKWRFTEKIWNNFYQLRSPTVLVIISRFVSHTWQPPE